MKRFLHARAALFAALSVLLAGTLPGQARTLVYCSEGNPESPLSNRCLSTVNPLV